MDSSFIFHFLRQFLYDKEFEETKTQLAESKVLLAEYRDFIQNERLNQEMKAEEKKVDPDFLVMIWASIGLALTIGAEAATNIPKVNFSQIKSLDVTQMVWLIIAFYMVFYIAHNGMFAMSLTLDYSKAKKDIGYRWFAITLIIAIVLLFAGIVVISQFGTSNTS